MTTQHYHQILSPIAYLGGKDWLARRIDRYVPPHTTYVEVFAGSAKVFFAKPPSTYEVINDIDQGLVNLFRVIADPKKVLEFERLTSLTLFSREEYSYCKKHWEDYSDEVQRAWAWFVAARQARFAHFSLGWDCVADDSKGKLAANVSRWLSTISLLAKFHSRLKGVRVENQDFRNIIPKFDSAETWYYVDPPYVWVTRHSWKFPNEMTDQDHLDLVDLLLGLEGTCLLSGYRNAIYEPLELSGWKREEFDVSCSSARITKARAPGQRARRQRRTECLWLSPGLQKALRQHSVELQEAA
jgi:DNA adenine methylase